MVCMQNVVLVSLLLVVVLITIELTRWILGSKQKHCHRPNEQHTSGNTATPEFSTDTNLSTSSVQPKVVTQPWPNPTIPAPSTVFAPSPLLVPPFNRITHGVPDEWTYCGYASPVSGTKPGKAVRYPLYVRQNLYQKNGYDYYVVDDSRNHVRINIDLPRGVYQLWSGDEINIDGETGKWVVTIDVPPDSTWQGGFPFFPRF